MCFLHKYLRTIILQSPNVCLSLVITLRKTCPLYLLAAYMYIHLLTNSWGIPWFLIYTIPVLLSPSINSLDRELSLSSGREDNSAGWGPKSPKSNSGIVALAILDDIRQTGRCLLVFRSNAIVFSWPIIHLDLNKQLKTSIKYFVCNWL